VLLEAAVYREKTPTQPDPAFQSPALKPVPDPHCLQSGDGIYQRRIRCAHRHIRVRAPRPTGLCTHLLLNLKETCLYKFCLDAAKIVARGEALSF
jgi:protocatechuate 3,4-dioxygenase beta subunit